MICRNSANHRQRMLEAAERQDVAAAATVQCGQGKGKKRSRNSKKSNFNSHERGRQRWRNVKQLGATPWTPDLNRALESYARQSNTKITTVRVRARV